MIVICKERERHNLERPVSDRSKVLRPGCQQFIIVQVWQCQPVIPSRMSLKTWWIVGCESFLWIQLDSLDVEVAGS